MWLTTGPTALRWCQRWGQHHRGDGPICGTVSLLVLHGGYPRCRRLAGLGRLGSIRPSYTLGVFAARRSAQTPRGVSSVFQDLLGLVRTSANPLSNTGVLDSGAQREGWLSGIPHV